MSSRFALVLGAGLLLAAGAASADHICTNSPDEAFVGYSQGGNGVAPMPICRWLEKDSAPPPKVVERWEVFDDRFGAWAIDESGAFGVSYGEVSREVADRKALQMCRERGGQRCVAIGQFRNLCSTFAWGGGRSTFDGGESVALSERRAVAACGLDSGVECDVIQTVCSMPVSRWVYEKPDNWVPAQR